MLLYYSIHFLTLNLTLNKNGTKTVYFENLENDQKTYNKFLKIIGQPVLTSRLANLKLN